MLLRLIRPILHMLFVGCTVAVSKPHVIFVLVDDNGWAGV